MLKLSAGHPLCSLLKTQLNSMQFVQTQLKTQQQRLLRHLDNWLHANQFSWHRSIEDLPYACKAHQLLLRRQLQNLDPRYQENKITNLAIALRSLDGILIRPGEVFSFWQQIGKPTRAKGYLEGLQLSKGDIKIVIGGGLCQLANLLYWMALHTPLEVLERHHQSFDSFPDDHRTLPFGTGASVSFNHWDLRFYNPTDRTFQLRVWIDEENLKGLVLVDQPLRATYRVYEKNHHFICHSGRTFRTNEIWRSRIDRRSGRCLKDELMLKNFAEVKYSLERSEKV
ncbi:MAG: VanW family protein [Oculatellaceae cyanobacterium Prado106]|jgi:vancomycin resistance protein VanW|nr:VanW family protein [Oculatellaceae cyanobacterium Prado106]